MTGHTSAASAARLRLLYDLGCAFTARLELDELIPLVVSKCCEVLEGEGGAVLLVDHEHDELYFPYVAGQDPEVTQRLGALRVPVARGIAGAVFSSGHPERVDDVRLDPRFCPDIDRATGFTTRDLLAAPLIARDGAIGVLQVVNRRSGVPFTDDDLAFLEALAGSVAVAIENARLHAQVKESEGRLRAQVGALRRDLARRDRFDEIIGTGPAMAEVFRLMESAAASPITVLIEGETGTGKELVARGIHRTSARADGPFIAVNCAAVTETLLESVLFGHRRGSFTGAAQDQRGLFEAASGGTIFLDEVGEMPAAMQAKLLRVLQEGEVVPVGETRARKVDVRVISATNRDLHEEVSNGGVRADLYYRLAAFPVRLPPLRQRREDIPLIADHVLAAAAKRHGKRITGIEPSALECFLRFDWPGNVRELENEIERAVALARDGEVISPQHLSAKLGVMTASAAGACDATTTGMAADRVADPAAGPAQRAGAPKAMADPVLPTGSLRQARAAFEARYVAEVLRQQDGNVSRAAQVLGLSRVMLQKKMKAYGLR